jgi:WD40 repeat protein
VKSTLIGHNDSVCSLAVLQNGDLASGSWDNTIKIWDTNTGSLKRTLVGHTGYVWSLAVLQNGDLASGSWDNTIKIWKF